MKTTIRNLRIIGISEGISFLVLLLIAMPLKYYVGFPLAVKYVGWIHGILFIAYILAVFFSIKAMRWGWFAVLVALGASLLPLGTFALDRQLKRRQEEL
jgi:integral membrane protein